MELFSGIGSQAKALKNLGVQVNILGTCEWDVHAIAAYDVIHNSPELPANIEAMGKKDKAVDLLQYVNQGKMPAFKAWLDANPTMAKAITKGGKIYYTPYFDGYQDVERMFVMDTNVTKAVLDATDFTDFDDIKSGKGGADNTLKEAKYTPYMDAEYNYRAKTTTVPCLDGDKVVNIDIKQTKNIIPNNKIIMQMRPTENFSFR